MSRLFRGVALGAAAASLLAPAAASADFSPREALGGFTAHAGAVLAAGDAVYGLVHGCYGLKSVANGQFVAADGPGYRASAPSLDGAEGFRMQATALGRYLLYSRTKAFPAEAADGSLQHVAVPGPAADFAFKAVTPDTFELTTLSTGKLLSASGPGGTLTLVPPSSAGPATHFLLAPATGCADFPEIDTNTTGTPSKGKTPYGTMRGWFDSIDHQMAFEFIGGGLHCGRPWSPYGASVALVDCPDHGPNGSSAALENALSFGDPTHMHTPDGWPGFKGWPTAPSLTHEQVYWKWLERAWRGGQRLMGGVAVDNAQLCELYVAFNKHGCDEMDVIRKELDDFYDMQDYIDAQSGGPGQGFFRIVQTPYEARAAINDGKLAVVLGMETSRPLDCRYNDDVSTCNADDVKRQMDDLADRGVRTMLLVNKFDNPLVGVTGDAGTTGIVINSGNRRETGHYWDLETCTSTGADKPQATDFPGTDEANFANGLTALLPPGGTNGAAPVYPKDPVCNKRGLTDLGERVLGSMMDRHWIVDVDHMSVRARNQSLSVLETRRYSGVISSHGWSTPDAFQRIYALGGMVTPYAGNSQNFATEWKRNRAFKSPKFGFGFGIGSDIEGLGSQGNPRPGAAQNPVTYPFKGLDPAVTLDRGTSNTRTWDINTDGVAQYGLYPDWIEDLRKIAGDGIVEDLAAGAENYVDMWERADGVPAEHCVQARFRLTGAGLGPMRLGQSHVALLRAAGQPAARPDRTWTYCGKGRDGRPGGKVRTVLTPGGALALIASTGAEHRIGGIGRGARSSRLPRTRRLTRTLRTAPAPGGGRFVFRVKGGRVTATAVASKAVARSSRTLKAYLREAGLR